MLPVAISFCAVVAVRECRPVHPVDSDACCGSVVCRPEEPHPRCGDAFLSRFERTILLRLASLSRLCELAPLRASNVMLGSALASAAALIALLPQAAQASPVRRWGLDYKPSVTIRNGTVNGAYLPTFDQDAFLGVPFAQPPVGDLRLRRPQSLNTSFAGGVYEATEYSPFVR